MVHRGPRSSGHRRPVQRSQARRTAWVGVMGIGASDQCSLWPHSPANRTVCILPAASANDYARDHQVDLIDIAREAAPQHPRPNARGGVGTTLAQRHAFGVVQRPHSLRIGINAGCHAALSTSRRRAFTPRVPHRSALRFRNVIRESHGFGLGLITLFGKVLV